MTSTPWDLYPSIFSFLLDAVAGEVKITMRPKESLALTMASVMYAPMKPVAPRRSRFSFDMLIE